MRFSKTAALIFACLSTLGAAPAPQTADFPPEVPRPGAEEFKGTISLSIDASDVSRRIVRIKERVPLNGEKSITLLYPNWLPGKHAPRGAIDKLAGLKFSVGGKPAPWRRDALDAYAFHVDIPEGAKALDIEAHYLSPTSGNQGRIEITSALANLQWNSMVLYPAGYPSDGINIALSLRLPKGWTYASALTPQSGVAGAGAISFKPETLETLVDSPMFTGPYAARYDLDEGSTAPVRLNLFGDSPEVISASKEQIDLHRNLVAQADKLFKSRHFDRYDFLLAISDELGGIGLEHHRSSENAPGIEYFNKQSDAPRGWSLLPHEYTHSWNGKFRRPADLYTKNFDVPMRDSLLWVYEGMTSYWGQILAARAEMWSTETALDAMADTAATYDYRVGRAWRPLEDTTDDPIILARRPQAWRSWQRGEDYYSEGLLIWLDADTLIREKTNGEKSLDDFAAAFFGIDDGRVTPATYNFDDVVATLNDVFTYDWATFLKSRLETAGGKAPLDGIARGGWRLVYTETPNAYSDKNDAVRKTSTFDYSIGLSVSSKNAVTAVQWDGPAFNAALKVGDELIAVDGEEFSAAKLKAAITRAKTAKAPIALLVKSGAHYRTIDIDYHGGLRYPHLERNEATPDRLGAIFAPK